MSPVQASCGLKPLAVVLIVGLVTAGCGTAQPTSRALALSSKTTIDNARSDYGGTRKGVVWLKRHVRVKVGTASNPSKAESVVEVSALAVNYGDKETTVALRIAAPLGAKLEQQTSNPAATVSQGPGVLDPDTLTFIVSASVPAKAHFEVVARYQVQGTLVSDVRRIYEAAPTAELLLSYHVPMDAVGSFGLVGADARPIVTSKDGVRIIAVMMRNLPPARGANSLAYARYVTRRAKPKGYKQSYASSWKRMLAPYDKAFGPSSKELRGGSAAPPVKPKGSGLEAIKELTLWTRNRIQRKDVFAGHWKAKRPLPTIIPKNDLYAVDKIHLLHWLLESAGIKHRVAVVRSSVLPPLADALPTPSAFDGALIFVPSAQLWLDPACQTCEPGQVSPRFQGRQAALLPAGKPALIRVPAP